MFGNIISIIDENIVIENAAKKIESNLIGMHLIFEKEYKVVCEILSMTKDVINLVMIGEFVNDTFLSGIIHKPNYDASIRIINKSEAVILLGKQDVNDIDNIYIGKSLIYEGYNVSANIDNFFSNHFAILGNTGSGKSCTVARVFQNLFYRTQNVPKNANIILFDVYGEYRPALDMINKTQVCRCKQITTNTKQAGAEIVKLPLYYMDVDDLALLLNVDSTAQIPIIEKALRYTYLFTEEEEKVIKHKNNIIAKALMDILTSGKVPSQIRDQIVAVLTNFYTQDINLESKIVQPGYIRTIRQCLRIDESGKINAIQLVIEYLEKFIDPTLQLNASMKPKKYKLMDLYNAFEFALISEGVLKSDKIYDINNILKIRLETIINSSYGIYFDVDEYIPKEEYIKRLFTNRNKEKVQIVNFNLNYVDERFAKVLTKIYSRLFFEYAVELEDRGGFPVQIVLEEAHRHVQNDNGINIIGYNVFDRITKEGRKYGVILGLITQRPSELSKTALSQCSNYIVLRMFHPEDLNIIKGITHSVSQSDIDKLKTLRPGVALCFGNAFNIPLFVKIDRPNPTPDSNNAHIQKEWFK